MITLVLTLPLLAGSPLATTPIDPLAAVNTVATPAYAAAPHDAILGQIRAFRNDDVAALIRSFVTDAQFEAMGTAWEAERKRTPDATENAEFTSFIERFGGDDAEQELWPELEDALNEMRPQLDMTMGMMFAMAEGAMMEDASVSPQEREKITAVMAAVQELLTEKDLTDPKLARRALAVVCETVRMLDVENLDDVYALSFEQLLDRAGVGLRGLKEALAIYGVELNGWLSSISAETLHTDGDYAVVRVKFSILGLDETSEVEMTRIAGRWFSKESADQAALLGN